MPLALACALALLVLVWGSVPAQAVLTRPLAASFGGKGSEDGKFEGPAGVAVREPTLSEPAEDVYVVDRGSNRVEQFSSTGAFIAAWGWGVSDGKAEYEVCTSGCRAGIAGEGAGQFDAPEAIAVDNSTSASDPSAGDVYVANTADNVVEKFASNGAYIGRVAGPFEALYGIAVDANGELWVYQSSGVIENFSDAMVNELIESRQDPRGTQPGFAVDSKDDLFVRTGDGGIEKLTSSGEEVVEIDEEQSPAVAVDLLSDEVFVGNVTSVREFSSSGSSIGRFGALSSTSGVAVSAAVGEVYVADSTANLVDAFTAPVVVPTVLVEAATGVQKKGGVIEGTLHGAVDPEGEEVKECFFEYGASLPSGKTVACEPAPGSSASAVEVHAPVSGLLPGTTYLYRVVARNANGANGSTVSEFGTPVAMPVSLEAVSGLEKNGASGEIDVTLNGSVTPEGEPVKACYFEYGASLPSGKTAPCSPAPGSSVGAVHVEAKLSGLQVETRYLYRLLAENTFGVGTSSQESFTTPVAVKGVGRCNASGLLNEAATLHGTLEPEGLSTSWYFEYRKFGSAGPWSKSAEGSAENPTDKIVEAEESVAGLERNTFYLCRLVAHNEFGNALSDEEDGEEGGGFTTALPPEVEGESVALVGFSGVTLKARIDGYGAADTFHFEYGTSESYGSSTPEVTLGHPMRGESVVSLQVLGLQPVTTYYFRVVVTQPHGGGTATGADATFTTFPASGAELPDGRVYEMVSPVEAQGTNVYVPEAHNGPFPVATMLPFQASGNGEAVAYAAAPAAGGNGDAGAGGGNEFIARSTPAGWVAQDVMPPGGGGSPVFLGFSSDLSAGIVESREPLSAGAPGGGFDVLYSRTSGDGSYHPLFSEAPSHRSAEEFASFGTVGPRGAGLAYAGASADSSDLLFEANDALAEAKEDPGREANDLYESAAGQLSLVNVLPGGEQAPDATFGAPNETGRPVDPPDFSDVISADGTRVFWTDLHAGLDEGHVYVRENGANTIPVSAGAARYWTATADGRYAFYTEGEKLYRFDVESANREVLAGAGAGVLGVIGASENGSYLYYVAKGKLAAGATEGQPNLYLLREGSTVFIATLAAEDEGSEAYGEGSFGDWEPGLGHRTAQVTPDGHSIVFESVLPLTGYDSEGLGEVFVYDAEPGGGLFCASCDPSGEAPPVTEVAGVRVKAASYLPVSWSRTYMPRVISEDGSRVFFDSFEPLVAPDSNAQQDVYEWERDGAGSCQEARGCEYLLSGATSRSGSYLVDASANGDDVFFVSDARLVPQDEDESDHLYDVRVGGVQPSAPAGCSGAACQQVPIAPLIFATPPSATFAGVGNFPPPAPAKVKPKPKHKHKHKQPKHKAKHGKQSSARKTGKRARRAGRGKAGRS